MPADQQCHAVEQGPFADRDDDPVASKADGLGPVNEPCSDAASVDRCLEAYHSWTRRPIVVDGSSSAPPSAVQGRSPARLACICASMSCWNIQVDAMSEIVPARYNAQVGVFLEQLVGIGPVLRRERDADADTDHDMVVIPGERLIEQGDRCARRSRRPRRDFRSAPAQRIASTEAPTDGRLRVGAAKPPHRLEAGRRRPDDPAYRSPS